MNRSLVFSAFFLTVFISLPMFSIAPDVFAQEPDYFFSVSLLLPNVNPRREATAFMLAQDLQKIGIHVDVVITDFAEYFYRTIPALSGMQFLDHDHGGFDMAFVGWVFLSGFNTFYQMYHSDGPSNIFPVRNETLDELIELEAYSRDFEQKKAYTHQISEMLAWDIMAETRLYEEELPFYYRDNIQGVATERAVRGKTLPTFSEFYFTDGHSYGHGQTNELIYAIPGGPNGYMWSLQYWWKQAYAFPYFGNLISFLVLNNVMGFLLQLDLDEWLVPELLTKLPTPASGVPNFFTGIPSAEEGRNATVWELELRDDIYWHEGYGYNMSAHADILNVDADDVVFTYQYVFDKIQVVKIDNHHVQFHFNNFNPLWGSDDWEIWHTFFGPLLPKHILEEGTIRADGTIAPPFSNWSMDDWSNGTRTPPFSGPAVIGTGPYILEGEDPVTKWITLRKNPYWFMNDDPRYSKRPEKVIFKIIPEHITATIELGRGDIDVMYSEFWGGSTILDHPAIITNPGVAFYPVLDWGAQFLQFNILNGANGTLADLNVRLAIAHMCDRQGMIDRTIGGLGKPNFVSPQLKSPFYPKNLEPIEYNLTRAIEYMERAGYNMDPYKPNPSGEVLHLEGISFVAIGAITSVVLVYLIKRFKRQQKDQSPS